MCIRVREGRGIWGIACNHHGKENYTTIFVWMQWISMLLECFNRLTIKHRNYAQLRHQVYVACCWGCGWLTCSCKKGTLRNLWRCISPNPFFMEASAYLTSAAPSGLRHRERERERDERWEISSMVQVNTHTNNSNKAEWIAVWHEWWTCQSIPTHWMAV